MKYVSPDSTQWKEGALYSGTPSFKDAAVFTVPQAEGALQTISNVAAAYSLRKLIPAYNSNCIKVRRSSDNSELDIPFCFDPVSREYVVCRNTLLRHAGTSNLFKYSEEFNIAPWAKSNTGSANPSQTATGVADPIGGATAETWSFGAIDDAGDFSVIYQGMTLSSTAYTLGIWLKAADEASIDKKIAVWINHSGTVTRAVHTLTSSWTKVTVTATVTGGGVFPQFGTVGSSRGGSNQDACNVSVWGAQLNAGSSIEPYTKSGVGAAGDGYIATWYDQSGNGINVTQTTAGSQPRIVNAGVLNVDTIGRPKLVFDGSSTRLSHNSTNVWVMINAVVRKAQNTTNFLIADPGGSSAMGLILDANNKLSVRKANNRYYSTTASASLANTVRTVSTATEPPKGFTDGIEETMATPGLTGLASSLLSIGATVTGSYPLNGDIQEVIMFSEAMSDTSRQKLERNQGAFYRITVA